MLLLIPESLLEQIIQNPKYSMSAAEGVDVSDEALEFCRAKGLKAHIGLAESLPFGDQNSRN